MATKVQKTATQMPGAPAPLGRDLQASRVEEPAALQVVAPATPPLLAFSRLVTGAAVAMGIEQAFARKPSARARHADSKIKAAWALSTEPTKLAALSMVALGKAHNNLHYNASDWNWMSQGALAGFSEPELEVLWAGAQELCEKIKAIGASDAMVDAAGVGSRLMVNAASPTLLSYPALGVGLVPGASILEGKKTATVNGVKLLWAGSAYKNERHYGQDLVAGDWALRLGGAEQAAPWMDQINQGIDFAKTTPGTPWADFAALDIKEAAAQSYLSGEIPLPSSARYAEAIQVMFSAMTPGQLAAMDFAPTGYVDGLYSRHGYAHKPGALGHRDVSPRAEYAKTRSAAVASTLISGWSWAISIALAPEAAKAAAGQLRGKKLDLSSGPFGQIDGADFEGATQDGWQDAIQKKGLDLMGVKLDFNAGRREHVLAVPHAMSTALAKAAEHGGKVDGIPTAYDLAEALSKSIFGKDPHLGSKFEAKAKELSKADASLGLLQLLGSLQLLRVCFENKANHSHRREFEAVKPVSALTARLEASLDALSQAMDVARRAYGTAAVEHAAGVERSWMKLHELDKAWDQAGQAGAHSPKSIGWAMANPIGDSLASDNPMARLAAQAARGLGLRAKAGEDELVASLVKELGEFGASPAAIQALPSQPKMREILADLASNLAGADKKKAHASRQALFFAVHAMNAAVSLGMPGPELERFAADYLTEDSVPAHRHRGNPNTGLDLFMAGATGSEGRFDGMGPGLSAFGVVDVDQAKFAGDVCRAKVEGYPKFIESLAADWRDSTQRALDLGQGQLAAWAIAAERAKEVREAYPKHALIDWRKKPFEGSALWQIFKMPSPRFSAAAADAVAKGGDLGLWCSQRARRLGVDDASDGNDLVGRSRDKIKQRCQMSDGAWKLAIKDPSILTVLTFNLRLDPEDRHHEIDSASLSDAACFDRVEISRLIRRVPGDSQDERIHADGPKSAGIALKAASVGGITPATVGVVLQVLTGCVGVRGHPELFADNIASVVASGAEGADFFVAEAAEKAARMPKIFIECCKRYEKLVADAAKEEARALSAPPQAEQAEGGEVRGGRFDPLKRFNDEIGDLCDWIGKSEHGLWTEIPKDPTFGQLSRMSKAWHDEQTAIAIDKADRQRVARAVAEAVHEADASANLFAVTSGSRWGKIIGRHARDSWEAVEMLSAAELTEEGATMHHCVSSYSPVCRSGESRIFSVRLNGERKCTLQIQGSSALSKLDEANTFRITQNKGPSNQAVNNAVTLAFCNEVLEKVNAIWPAVVGKIKKARDAKSEVKKEVIKKAKESELAKIEAERVPCAPKI